MTDSYVQVNIKILEKDYQISCPVTERGALLDSAEMLNTRMREIRDRERAGRGPGGDDAA